MNIHNFENHIPPKILDRGFSYYEYGNLQDGAIEQVFEGIYEAVVFGTEDYDVQISMDKQQNILACECSCSYDWTDVCKHAVAMLYYIKDAELYKEQPQTTVQELQETINKLSEAAAKKALMNLLIQYKNARQDFLEG